MKDEKIDVKLYVSDSCSPCDDVKEIISDRGLEAKEENISKKTEKVEELEDMIGGAYVPALKVGDKVVFGRKHIKKVLG